MHTWTVADRRRRLVARHHLCGDLGDVDGLPGLASRLVGLHATDPVSVYLQVHARIPGVAADQVAAMMYDQRCLARVLAMRRTMFIVSPDDMPMLRAAITDKLAARELRRSAGWLADDGLADDGEAWMRAAGDATLAALREYGPMTALQLREVVPALATQVITGRGTRWEGKVGMSTRVLFWLATVGTVMRGRPGGSLASSNWTWVPTDDWLGADVLIPMDRDEAAVALAGRYLATFGPATSVDLQWWTGWTKTMTRAALSDLDHDVVEVQDGRGDVAEAYVVAGDGDPAAEAGAVEHPVALLPALDATPMGWKERSWYAGEHTSFPSALFDGNGNIGPTVWHRGRIVGAWAQRDDGGVRWRLFDDLADDEVGSLAEALPSVAGAVEAFLGGVGRTPRFPTPWQVELRG